MKEVNDEVDFLHVEEHEGFVQINTMALILGWSSIPLVSKIASF